MRDCLDDGILQSYFDNELSFDRRENVTAHLASCSKCAAAARELEIENSLLASALEPEFAANVPTARLRERIDSAITGGTAIRSAERSPRRRWSLSDLFPYPPQPTFGYAALVLLLALVAVFAVLQLRPSGQQQLATEFQPVATPTVTRVPESVPIVAQAPNPLAAPTKDSSSRPPSYRRAPARRVPEQQQIVRVKLLPGERSYLKTIAALDSTIKAEGNRPMRPSLQVEYERNLALVDRALAAARSAAKNNPNDPDAAEFMFSAYQSKVDLLNTVADARLNNRQQ